CQVADGEGVRPLANRVHDPAMVVGGQGALDGALEPESLAEVGLFHGVNLTARAPRRARRRARAGRPDRRGTWPACRWAPVLRSSPPGRAPGAETSDPTCCRLS